MAVALATGLGLAAGCGSDSGGDGRTLLLWHAGGPLFKDAIAPVLAEYKKEYPDVTVDVQAVDWASFQQRVLSAAAANQLPCVMYSNSQVVGAIAKKNVMTPVPEDVIDSAQRSQYLKGFTEAFADADGKQLFVPFLGGANMWYVRTDTAAGQMRPKTYSEWIAWGKQNSSYDSHGNLTKEGMGWRWNTPGPGMLTSEFSSMVVAAGGQFVDDSGAKASKALFNSDAGMQAIQFMHDTIWKYKISFPPEKQPLDKQNILLSFLKGDQAANFVGPWLPNAIASLATGQLAQAAVKWDAIYTAPQPDSGGSDVIQISTDGWGVPRTCKNPDLAWNFVKFLTSQQSNIKFFKVYQHPVARVDAMTSAEVAGFVAEKFAGATHLQDLWKDSALGGSAVAELHTPANADIYKAVEDPLVAAMNNSDADLKATLSKMADNVNTILSRTNG